MERYIEKNCGSQEEARGSQKTAPARRLAHQFNSLVIAMLIILYSLSKRLEELYKMN